MDQKTIMEDYNSTLGDIWQFSPKFHFDPPFDTVICMIWTPPLIDRLNSWNLLVSKDTTNSNNVFIRSSNKSWTFAQIWIYFKELEIGFVWQKKSSCIVILFHLLWFSKQNSFHDWVFDLMKKLLINIFFHLATIYNNKIRKPIPLHPDARDKTISLQLCCWSRQSTVDCQ